MKVSELVSLLQSKNQDARVQVSVGWSEDTAFSDEDGDPSVETDDEGVVVIGGWKSNTSGCLEVGEEEEEEEEGEEEDEVPIP